MDRVPTAVGGLVTGYLAAVDRAAPGLVEGFYLTGSVALGDYHPGASDVDFLAVCARPLGGAELAALSTVHGRRPGTPHLDGIYLERAILADPPDAEQPVPHVVDGAFRTGRPCGELNPVLWLTLARHGVTVRGPAAADLAEVRPDRLRRWNLDNLARHWVPHAAQIRAVVADRAPDEPARAEAVVWTVLGPARLHYTLATGDVLSKTAAGGYVADRFPAWAGLAARAVAARTGFPQGFTTVDAIAAADLTGTVAADAARYAKS